MELIGWRELVSTPLGASCLLAVLAAFATASVDPTAATEKVRIRVRRRPRTFAPPVLTQALSSLGLVLAIGSGPAAAGTRAPVSPDRRLPDVAPPWSEAGGFPPPRPLARTGVVETEPVDDTRARHRGRASRHRALHAVRAEEPGGHGSSTGPLFPRERRRERAELEAAMARHPSGKGKVCPHHVVRPGESLWSIAQGILGTDDPRAIARYWPKIHRANRTTIGPDPRLIHPGQVLQLPSCE